MTVDEFKALIQKRVVEPTKCICITFNNDSIECYLVYGTLIHTSDKFSYPDGELIKGQEPNFTVSTETDPTPKKIFLADIKSISSC